MRMGTPLVVTMRMGTPLVVTMGTPLVVTIAIVHNGDQKQCKQTHFYQKYF